jgi:hypothetical protein
MRTIIVGDVHGCREELDALLDRVAFANGDRLVFVGDLVARGPDSLGVLDIVRRTGAIVVRGNHEQKLIDWLEDNDEFPIGKLHRELARSLRPVDWSLIQNMPLWVDLPDHALRIVHAGIVPGIPFEKQKEQTLLRIRTVRGRRRGEHVLWGERYAGPPHILFGHNAAPGLQLHPWATGLDTGCVYGGRLTAVVLAPGQKMPKTYAARRDVLVSERARRMWFAPASLRKVA